MEAVAEGIAEIDRAREAVARESWAEAYEAYRSLDLSVLSPQDLESFADAAWWLSRFDDAFPRWEEASAAYAAAGEDANAAFVAVRLCFEHFGRDEPAAAMGWLMKAQRLLEDRPEGYQLGFVLLAQAMVAQNTGDVDGGMALAVRATEIGKRFGHRDLIALGIHGQGLVLVSSGRVSEGMALLDEAMTSVVAGELSTHFTGVIYCNVLDVCLDLADVRRAGEWSDAAKRWCETLPPEAPFPGTCRVNRAAVASLRGAWPEAEAEAARAAEDWTFNPEAAAKAFYETGEIRRRVGNLSGADEAFARAHELGLEPQPGLALLRLAQGKVDAALTSLRLAVAASPEGTPRRARLLAAQVEVALAGNDLDTAETASAELDAVAQAYATPAFDASAATARGALLLARGDVTGALEYLRRACAVWQELKLPYDTARARMRYAMALREAGDAEGALLELRTALAAFERLGAELDARAAADLLSGPAELPGGLTPREAEVLRLIATGKTNREIAADLVLSEHTVARHTQNIFHKLAVTSRSAATAFAYEHGLA